MFVPKLVASHDVNFFFAFCFVLQDPCAVKCWSLSVHKDGILALCSLLGVSPQLLDQLAWHLESNLWNLHPVQMVHILLFLWSSVSDVFLPASLCGSKGDSWPKKFDTIKEISLFWRPVVWFYWHASIAAVRIAAVCVSWSQTSHWLWNFFSIDDCFSDFYRY